MQRPFFYLIIVCVGAAIVAAGGCTQVAKSPPPPRAVDTVAYDWQREGTIPPLDLADMERAVDRVDVFEDIPVRDEDLAVQDVKIEYVPVVADTADTTDIVGRGYRVQVFASGSQMGCEEVRRDAAEKLGTNAYVEFVDGIYKVRVGDCFSRPEAEALLTRCRTAGYRDAWIVASEVRRPRAPAQPDSLPESTPGRGP